MILDDVVPYGATKERAAQAVERTQLWTQRFLAKHSRKQLVFGINQGSVFPDLRKRSSELLATLDVDGYAIGGLRFGEPTKDMDAMVKLSIATLPSTKPRYLMGVGKPDDIVGAVKRGVDMMDCVLPSRSGRTGQAWTRRGQVNIKNARHQDDPRPLDEECTCPACRNYSRAYLHHVFRAQEMISGMLLTWHNLHYFQEIMSGMRAAIAEGRFDAWQADFHAQRAQGI